MTGKPFVVACIPAFNEEGRIGGVVVQARKYVDRVVVCDDGSGDLTGEIAEGLRAVGCGMSGTGATVHISWIARGGA
jgi:glycosyltransferase involved in cell wall biosynthesis